MDKAHKKCPQCGAALKSTAPHGTIWQVSSCCDRPREAWLGNHQGVSPLGGTCKERFAPGPRLGGGLSCFCMTYTLRV